MTVHVLIPVFNRLAMTQSVLASLRGQQAGEAVSIVVIDDGSTDGTADYLGREPDVTVLRGDGSLWWGGAVDRGMQHVLALAAPDDWVLLVNNDTRMDPGFIRGLLALARREAPAALGCAVRNEVAPHALLSVGPRIDGWRMVVTDVLRAGDLDDDADAIAVDALSGRGVLYPVAALRAVDGMRPAWLPHYLADYELSLRVQSAGWKLRVSTRHVVYSAEEFGSSLRFRSVRERLFSVRSPSYLRAQVRFWWEASSFWQKASLPLRLPLLALFPRLRRKP
jgi:N-acetylglucosaminyl-diphospho-decaprenol L-rhamnosyltransferase